MESNNPINSRPVALVILDGWGYAPRSERNAIAMAHTPNYDEICRLYPMTTLSASTEVDGKSNGAESGHLRMGTGRAAQTEVSQIKNALESGAFIENGVLNTALAKARSNGSAVHLIGLLSDAGVHSSIENLFALLRMAKHHELQDVFVHCILDGRDVAKRTADVYAEALELKFLDIGTGKIASLCGRYFAMDTNENWERTARAYTMLVHGEGERASDAVTAIRNSFLRGFSEEFISPIVLGGESSAPMTTIKDGDLVVYFNHRADGMLQLARSISVPEGSARTKPSIDTVCLTEYDPGFELGVAFRHELEKNTLTEILTDLDIPNYKITESSRSHHLTHFFDGGSDKQRQVENQMIVSSPLDGLRFGQPDAESFKITDKFLRGLESTDKGVFVINMPAADMMAATGDIKKTVAAVQYIDTCLGGICDGMRRREGVVMITSTHGNCEEMFFTSGSEDKTAPTTNPVPFHYVDLHAGEMKLCETGTLEDVAPTVLGVLGIDKPAEMTGKDLRLI